MSSDTSVSPTNSKHPFWSSPKGSTLHYYLPLPNFEYLKVNVHSTEPRVYRVVKFRKEPVFCDEKEVMDVIENEWLKDYGDKTDVKYEEKVEPEKSNSESDSGYSSVKTSTDSYVSSEDSYDDSTLSDDSR